MLTPGPRHRRAAVAATTAVLLTFSLAACTPDDSRADSSVPSGLSTFYGQKLRWEPCGTEECAELKVPMDYADPTDGRTFVLPLIRVPASDPGRRIGSLVFNPGGPGESGVGLLKDGGVAAFSERVQKRFDIVGFDPRGVAGSKPAVDCGPEGEALEGDEAPDAEDGDDAPPQPLHPATAQQRETALADAQSALAACEKHSGAILPHVGTADAARDMDVLRAVLGDDKLSYLGWSYGTSLGTTYGELFPRRVRAMVLDGAIDPSLDWSQRARSQAKGFREAVDDYAEHCAEVAGDACPADSPAGIRELLDRLYAKSAEEPLPVDGSEWGLDAVTLHSAVTASMYTPEEQWEPLSVALSDAGGGDGTRLAAIASGEEAGEETGEEAAEDSQADADGEAEQEDEAEENGPPDNSDVALTAVNCVDIPHPEDPKEYWKALDQAHRSDGDFGSDSVVAALGCKGWPQAGPGPHKVRAEGLPPVLVVGTTGDPSTPYREAEELARQLPGGMLLTYEGLGHTAYGRGGACVDGAVDDYLIGLEPVKDGATC